MRAAHTLIVVTAFTVGLGTLPALADQKSECLRGVSMIKAALAKKHPDDMRERLRQALANAQNEVVENDWSECVSYITQARSALRK
jgi:hypothetical protein